MNIGGQPAARAGDRATCAGPDDTIVQGSPTVFIDGRPAARVGDKCAHMGMIVTGCSTVNIGNEGGGGSSSGPIERRDDENSAPTGSGGRSRPDEPSLPENRRRGPASDADQAVPRAGEQAVPRAPAETTDSKDTKESKDTKKAKNASPAPTKLASPTLFGSPATMELVQSLFGLARTMFPNYDQQLSRFDPQSLDAMQAQLKDAIARKDVDAVSRIGERVAQIIQNGGAIPQTASPGVDQGSAPSLFGGARPPGRKLHY